MFNFEKNFLEKLKVSLFDQFPLLEKTNLIEKEFLIFQNPNPQDEFLDFNFSKNRFENVLKEIFKLKIRSSFFKITMHKGYTKEEFKKNILNIINEYNSAKLKLKLNSNFEFSTVVFVDELNTASILDVIKEVFIEKRVDGKNYILFFIF
jgi:hypothetical protein